VRLPIAIAALAVLATPAATQRLNTVRNNLHSSPHGTVCGFDAYPEMTLIDGAKAGGKVASWNGAAAEDKDARMKLVWEPAASNWRTPPFLGVGFTIPASAALSQGSVGGASLIIDDGKPIPLLYNASGNKLIFAANRDTDNAGARVIGSDGVVLEILDPAGKSLRRYSWDTRRLADAVETVSVVRWSCTSP
jgi:hypothetical protein